MCDYKSVCSHAKICNKLHEIVKSFARASLDWARSDSASYQKTQPRSDLVSKWHFFLGNIKASSTLHLLYLARRAIPEEFFRPSFPLGPNSVLGIEEERGFSILCHTLSHLNRRGPLGESTWPLVGGHAIRLTHAAGIGGLSETSLLDRLFEST